MRKNLSDVTLSMGMLSVMGDLYGIKKPNAGKEEELNLVCPTCAAAATKTKGPASLPSQRYICNDDPKHVFTSGEAARGRMVDGKVVVLTAEQIEEAKVSLLPEREFELQPFLRADVEAQTFESGAAYVFKPSGKGAFYGILIEFMKKRPDICFLAVANMRKSDHMIMVQTGLNNNLIIRDMIWPEDMAEFTAEPYDAKPALLAQAEMLIEASVEPFDPTNFKRDSREKITAAIAAAAGGPVKAKTAGKKKPVSDDDSDLVKAMQAAIDAKKKEKKTA